MFQCRRSIRSSGHRDPPSAGPVHYAPPGSNGRCFAFLLPSPTRIFCRVETGYDLEEGVVPSQRSRAPTERKCGLAERVTLDTVSLLEARFGGPSGS